MARPVCTTDPVVWQLLAALGLDPAKTRKVVIVIEPDALVTAHVVLCPDHGDLARAGDTFAVNRVESVEVGDRAEIVVRPYGA